MEQQTRLILTIGLIFGFLFFWTKWFSPKPTPVSSQSVQQPASATPNNVKNAQLTDEAKPQNQPSPSQPQNTTALWEKTIETPLMRGVLSNLSGSLTSLELKKFKNTRTDVADLSLLPLGKTKHTPSHWVFQVSGVDISDETLSFLAKEEKNQVTFQAFIAPSIELTKTHEWNDLTYEFKETIQIKNKSPQNLALIAKKVIEASEAPKPEKRFLNFGGGAVPTAQFMAMINDETHRWPFEKWTQNTTVPAGPVSWVGAGSHYFLHGALPVQGLWEKVTFENGHNETKAMAVVYPQWNIPSMETQTFSLKYYVGPKNKELLDNVDPKFSGAIDLGGSFLSIFSIPILKTLKKIYSVIPNYGIAIILLTVFVRLLLFPLTQIQAKSMKRMQEHTPHLNALKEKFKDNKEQYSKEVMNYMRTHKLNPAGGCLLLLPQLPVFFALYRVLYNAIELRHAPFFGWIQDLSAFDPYFILPILLSLAMVLQQKLTPAPSADPAQQMMMKVMPVLFGFFMLFLPSGLNLYILVSTLWGVAQQAWVQKGNKLSLSRAA